jgi:SAM-dependent methyltransferase
MIPPPPSFDGQAQTFDARAGLPEAACREIAAGVAALAQLKSEDLLLEIGAGTGEIGIELCRLGARYLGIDVSTAMLELFERRLSSSPPELRARARLGAADANQPWPVDGASVRAVFGSRSLHLLDAAHVVSETCRVAAKGRSVLLVGRVGRSPESVRARMRSRMRRLLGEHGREGRSGEKNRDSLTSACVARGAVLVPEQSVASWPVRESPARSLAAWSAKPGLSGMALPDREKTGILAELREWALREFGALDTELDSREEYLLGGAVFDEK